MITSCSIKEKVFMDNKRFIQLEKELDEITEIPSKQERIDDFIKTLNSENYPIFENDSTVVLLFQTNEGNAYIVGDMAEGSFLPMQKIDHSNLFYYRAHYEKNARLEYWLTSDRDSIAGVDPLNPFIVYNGFGPMSELAMPGYKRHKYFDDYIYGKKGNLDLVESLEINSDILHYSHLLHVYLPAGYKSGTNSFPVIYIQDGIDYIEFAQASHVINKLIKEKKIEPVITVFITPPNRLLPGTPNRMTEYGLNDDYVSFICDELVPFIDSKYRTEKISSSRMIVGDSFAGLISAYIPFSRPEVFQLGYSQSGYASFQNDQLIIDFSSAQKQDIRLYIDIGIYERNVGGMFLPASETDFLMANRRFKKVLENKSYDFVYHEYFEGHTWGNWRRHLIDGLIHFFGTENN